MNVLYDEYKQALQKIADIRYASALLQWDQETYMPPKGAATRGRQIATLSELAHQTFTNDNTGALLQSLLAAGNLTPHQQRNAELSFYDYTKSKKLPADFVWKLSEAINQSFHSWIHARRENNFFLFQDQLQAVIDLKRQEAEYLGYETHPYNALMNDYDRGLTISITDKLFQDLAPKLTQIISTISAAPQVKDDFLRQHFPKDKQWALGLQVLHQMHYDMSAGRQDISEHPFTINFGSTDVRVTTRIDEHDFANMLWSCIHEGGHALYEQGLPAEQYGLPLGEYCSLSIHESQSRLWENNLGRSHAFWQFYYPAIQQSFPDQFGAVPLQEFYRAINKVQPSLIRTEADELTYHFHVMIRYEIEKKLIGGEIAARDIPAIWDEYYLKYLDVKVPDHKQGCLQDVHWSHGSFGYFATYSLGSLYAAQMHAAIAAENPSLEQEVAAGNYSTVMNWLKQHIYPFGRYYSSEELCKKATGESLNSSFFIDYATKKFTKIYGGES